MTDNATLAANVAATVDNELLRMRDEIIELDRIIKRLESDNHRLQQRVEQLIREREQQA